MEQSESSPSKKELLRKVWYFGQCVALILLCVPLETCTVVIYLRSQSQPHTFLKESLFTVLCITLFLFF